MCLTRDRGAAGSSLTGNVSLSKTINPLLSSCTKSGKPVMTKMEIVDGDVKNKKTIKQTSSWMSWKIF